MILRAHLFAAVHVVMAASACGGRVATSADAPVGPDGALLEPVPTCGAICAHIVGTCAPGGNTAPCVTDCEAGQSRFTATCAPLLDAYRRCMIHTRVECHAMDIVVIDCSDERNQLDSCHP